MYILEAGLNLRKWRCLQNLTYPPSTRHSSLRPGGASLLAQTLRSEQGGDRSRAQWSRLAPPPPLFHLTHGLRRRAPCSGVLAARRRLHDRARLQLSRTGSRSTIYPVTTPTGREEPGTSLYPSYNDPPHAPRPGSCQEATFGVSCTPSSPGPGGSGPASSPSSPLGPDLATGAVAGAVGSHGV